MVGFGESGSGTFSLSACCARQILNGKNATTTSKMKNSQRRKFRLSLGRMKCAATYHLSTAVRVPRIKHVLFHKFPEESIQAKIIAPVVPSMILPQGNISFLDQFCLSDGASGNYPLRAPKKRRSSIVQKSQLRKEKAKTWDSESESYYKSRALGDPSPRRQ